jgi:hypothetical protein
MVFSKTKSDAASRGAGVGGRCFRPDAESDQWENSRAGARGAPAQNTTWAGTLMTKDGIDRFLHAFEAKDV